MAGAKPLPGESGQSALGGRRRAQSSRGQSEGVARTNPLPRRCNRMQRHAPRCSRMQRPLAGAPDGPTGFEPEMEGRAFGEVGCGGAEQTHCAGTEV